MNYTFYMDLDVDDVEDLYRAAMAVDGSDEVDLRPSGSIDVEACLIMLIDPGQIDGCSIHQSYAIRNDQGEDGHDKGAG